MLFGRKFSALFKENVIAMSVRGGRYPSISNISISQHPSLNCNHLIVMCPSLWNYVTGSNLVARAGVT